MGRHSVSGRRPAHPPLGRHHAKTGRRTVPFVSLTFRLLFGFIVLRHDRRELVHINVTDHPTAQWTAQQIVDAFPYDAAPRYLLRDRDATYGAAFTRRIAGLGMRESLIAPRAPWQNPFAERLIGSLRRECLDHFLVVNSGLHGAGATIGRDDQEEGGEGDSRPGCSWWEPVRALGEQWGRHACGVATEWSKTGRVRGTESRPPGIPSQPPPAYQKGENSRTGEPTRRGPDKKPRQVYRLGITRALVAGKQKKNGGPPVSGFEDMCLGFREILGDHRLENRGHFLRLTEKVKETFDDAPDSGSGRTTVFLFPSQVEEEMKRGGALHPGEQKIEGAPPAGPLAGMKELEEP